MPRSSARCGQSTSPCCLIKAISLLSSSGVQLPPGAGLGASSSEPDIDSSWPSGVCSLPSCSSSSIPSASGPRHRESAAAGRGRFSFIPTMYLTTYRPSAVLATIVARPPSVALAGASCLKPASLPFPPGRQHPAGLLTVLYRSRRAPAMHACSGHYCDCGNNQIVICKNCHAGLRRLHELSVSL